MVDNAFWHCRVLPALQSDQNTEDCKLYVARRRVILSDPSIIDELQDLAFDHALRIAMVKNCQGIHCRCSVGLFDVCGLMGSGEQAVVVAVFFKEFFKEVRVFWRDLDLESGGPACEITKNSGFGLSRFWT